MIVTRADMNSMSVAEYDRRQDAQFDVFRELRGRVDELLERFGRPDFLPGRRRGDYDVQGDYHEYPGILVFIHSLELLRPPTINALQQLLQEYSGWKIDLGVALWDHLNGDWPDMGVSIRQNEIVENLQRQYFPKEYQDLTFENSRRGSQFD